MKRALVGNTHLVAGTASVLGEVLELLAAQGVETKGNSDIYVREYSRFGIDDARELRERSQLRPSGERRYFVIATPTMTSDAQNALLKTLEEPPADAHFFFIVTSPQSLLATLRSRAQILELENTARDGQVDATSFLAANASKRLDMLSVLLEKDDDDRRDLRPIFSFLALLEERLAKHREGLHAARGEGVEAVYRARKYIGDKGALVKPLLEQVALVVPVLH